MLVEITLAYFWLFTKNVFNTELNHNIFLSALLQINLIIEITLY